MNCHCVFKTQKFWHAINTGKTKIILLLVQGSGLGVFCFIKLQNRRQAITSQVTTVISLPSDNILEFFPPIYLNHSYWARSVAVHSWLPIKVAVMHF